MTDAALDARYGRSRRRGPRAWWIAAGALVVALAVWLAWSVVSAPTSQLEYSDVGFERADDEVAITWDLTVEPGTEVSCALQALSGRFSVVGWKVVDVPASDSRTRRLTESIRTVSRAESGLIYRCWLP